MRKFVTVVLVLFILCGCTAVKKDNSNGEIVIGSDQFEPFSYIDNGEMKGIDVDIAKEALSRMGYTPVFKQIEWQKKDEYLRSGEIDCIWGCFSMDDREDLYAWVGPYLFSNQSVMVKEDSDIYSLADLKNKIVGVQTTSKAEWAFENNNQLDDIRYLYTFSTINEVFISLQRAYVDAVAGHELALRALIRGSDDYRFLDEIVLTSKLGVAFKKGYDQSFLALLANTLHEMRNDGTIKKIVDSYTSNVMMEDGNE